MENKCVCCDEVIPEGRQVCPNCEAQTVIRGLGLNVICSFTDKCLHIDNSYLITSDAEIKSALRYIRKTDAYKRLQGAGYTRTPESEYQEWKAHNVLYSWGIARERTGHVDIDQNEGKFRRFIYAILSNFEVKGNG